VPAAAVIPAPIAYIKVVAVKKLVVGSRGVSPSSKNDIQEGPVRCGAALASHRATGGGWVAQPGVYRPTRPLLPASRPSY
jgi:hypothetical protein